MNEIWIETTKGNIYGQAAGAPDSPLVLALHGWSQRNGWHTWRPLLAPLADGGFYAVSVDMPGWGQSESWGSGPLGPEEAVEAVKQMMDGLGKVQASLLGKSWGGGIALLTALTHPEKVEKLVLSAPAFQRVDRLKDVPHQALLVWAEDDPVIPHRQASVFKQGLAHSQLVSYPQGGHSAGPKNAEDFAPKVTAFLRGGGSGQSEATSL